MRKILALIAMFLVVFTFTSTTLEARSDGCPFSDRAVVNPVVDPGDPPVSERVVLACSRIDVELLSNLTGAVPFANVWDCELRGGAWGGKSITIAGPMVGAPYAVMVTEKLIALGARMVLLMGWCGSLNANVRIGELVLPTLAVSGEGTSAYYRQGIHPPRPDQALCEGLRAQLAASVITWHHGSIWSTDAIYRETDSLVKHHQRLGNLGVDMESSAMFTLGSYRGVAVATLLVASDELFTMHWNPGFNNPAFNKGRGQAAQVILDAAAAWENTKK